MNRDNLVKQYGKLTPDERFRLVNAACARGDSVERERLNNTATRIHFDIAEHGPYGHVFLELQFRTFIDLLADAALLLESSQTVQSALRELRVATRVRQQKKQMMPQRYEHESDTVDWPSWDRATRAVRATGFMLKVKNEGWKLFCERQNSLPTELWEQLNLPGLNRLARALALVDSGVTLSTAEMAMWVNENKAAGDREVTEADIQTPEWYADLLDDCFRTRLKDMGWI
jgi:hypothetical protein